MGGSKISHKSLLVTKEDRVATVTLNRPEKLNAANYDVFEEVPQALGELAKDSDIGTVILTGAGRAFCTGADDYNATQSAVPYG